MRKVFTAGEALVDIIFRDGQPRAASVGGAMLNTSVSLGRAGLPVFFISEYGNDDPGKLIGHFLNENGVNTEFTYRYTDGRTAIALAFLDENNEARYTFYKQYPLNRLEIESPVITSGDFFLFGSIYAITPEVREKLFPLAEKAHKEGAITLYDPNFRSPYSKELDSLMPLFRGNIGIASLVRASDQDCMNIFGVTAPEEAWSIIKDLCGCLVYTAGTKGVWVFTTSFKGRFPVKEIQPVSTIGAGDTFNAGLIAAFLRKGLYSGDIQRLKKADWQEIISTAVDFATEACMSYENYIGLAFASRYRSASGSQV